MSAILQLKNGDLVHAACVDAVHVDSDMPTVHPSNIDNDELCAECGARFADDEEDDIDEN